MPAVSATVQDMMSKDLMGKLYIPVKEVIKNKGGQLEQEWQLQLNGNPAGMLALALRWTNDASGTDDPKGVASKASGQRKKGYAVQEQKEPVSTHAAAVTAFEQPPELDKPQLLDDVTITSTLEVPAKQLDSTFPDHDEAQSAAVSGTTLRMPEGQSLKMPTGAIADERAMGGAETPASTVPPTPALTASSSVPRTPQVRRALIN